MKSDSNLDLKLINEIKKDDYVSYNKLFTRYYNPLCYYVYQMIKEKSDAEDIVQELFLNLWANHRKLDIHTAVSFYLYKTARNLTLNYVRDHQKYYAVLEQIEQSPIVHDDHSLELQEFRHALNDCINRLPARSKEILLLHRIKGLKQKEISEKLDISVKTIKNQIWNALRNLRNCLSAKEI
ncbi:MAG: RNA polymerase sigma-70 factor [Tannerellaceae bacterium]|nr:RNA polymerase sigma-70 factor [Tannerellaceae bacterium]